MKGNLVINVLIIGFIGFLGNREVKWGEKL